MTDKIMPKEEHENYISTPYHSIGGWKVCLMTWVKDETGEYYDVWNTSDGFKNSEKAASYSRGWAQAEGIEYAGDKKESKPFPTVSPERLAEILKKKSSGLSFDLSFKQYFKNFATELSNALDIREKEQPCCDSPGKEKCMQCQVLDRRD